MLGYITGGVARGVAVGLVVTVVASLLADLRVENPVTTVAVVLMTSVLFSLAGLLNVPLLWLLEGEDPSGRSYHPEALSETAKILQKLERAQAIQQEVATLLAEATADVNRLQKEFDAQQDFAA